MATQIHQLTEKEVRKGGLTTKYRFGVERCPHCGQIVATKHYETIGMKGGMKNAERHNTEHFQKIGAMGGRGNTREKRSRDVDSRQ
jgi:hypothetical protein